jgi:hypothetical protein
MDRRRQRISALQVFEKLDRIEKLLIAVLKMERIQMATNQDLNAAIAEMHTSVRNNTDRTAAIAEVVTRQQGLYDQALKDLEEARSQNDPAALDAAIAEIKSIKDLVDADTLAEEALAGTGAEPTE